MSGGKRHFSKLLRSGCRTICQGECEPCDCGCESCCLGCCIGCCKKCKKKKCMCFSLSDKKLKYFKKLKEERDWNE